MMVNEETGIHIRYHNTRRTIDGPEVLYGMRRSTTGGIKIL
jgi:hypothetical protein